MLDFSEQQSMISGMKKSRVSKLSKGKTTNNETDSTQMPVESERLEHSKSTIKKTL